MRAIKKTKGEKGKRERYHKNTWQKNQMQKNKAQGFIYRYIYGQSKYSEL